MKLLLIGIAALPLAVSVVAGQSPEPNPLVLFVIATPFVALSLGALWMMYLSTRYEKKPLPILLLAMFVPFSFLWYYFGRVRPGKLRRNHH